jgi:putative tricarboxylic transport membrane protein
MEFLEVLKSFADISVCISLVAGVIMGIIGGCLPGISPSMTIALMLPITLYLPEADAIASLMGAYQGAMFGGSVSAILINTPGTASAAATAIDGYEMAKAGKARKALLMSLYASCTGGLVGTIILLFLAQFLAKVALKFGPPEYFGLMMLSMALIAGISGKSLLKGIVAGGLGLLFSTVGLDPIYGSTRFTFGNIDLYDGINTLSVFIGVFALSEIMMQLSSSKEELNRKPDARLANDDTLTFKEYWNERVNILISGVMGALIGVLPGIGGSTASFVAYASAQKRSKTPEKFGKGCLSGVAAPEAANNAVCGGALVPMLTLGVPGDVVTAILVGALIAHGIKPGPLLFVENIASVYTVYIALFFAIIVLAVVGHFGVPAFASIVKLRKSILLPLIFIICIIGTYASAGKYFDVYAMLFFGVIGFLLRKYGYPLSPLIIAFVIGGQLESNLRRSLLLDDSGVMILLKRPLSAFLIVAAVVFMAFMIRSNYKDKKAAAAKQQEVADENDLA